LNDKLKIIYEIIKNDLFKNTWIYDIIKLIIKRRIQFMKKSFYITLTFLMVLFIIDIYAMGPPSSWLDVLGQEIAGNIASSAIMDAANDYNRSSIDNYKSALWKYKRELERLKNKYLRQRRREEKIIQNMLDELQKYDAGDPDVNRIQKEKMTRIYEKAQEFQTNEINRANALRNYINNNYPNISDYQNTL
jgi:hypothetical protein